MKITKHEHACFTVEDKGKLLIVDPGVFTNSIGSPENVIGIVFTHEHTDHFDSAALGAIIAHNPSAVILAPQSIMRQLDGDNDAFIRQSVVAGDTVTVGPFTLEFYGGEHAVIHPDIPTIPNVGVMINSTVFYPGDSFVVPDKPVEILALPISAPWLKIQETIDYLVSVKPTIAFPTHDAILSKGGKDIADRMIASFASKAGIRYQRIDTTPIDI